MAIPANKTTGKAVADVKALYFLKHINGEEPEILKQLDSDQWFPVLSLKGSVSASQDAPSIEKINVDQFDAPIGITTEPGDFNFSVNLPSLRFADLAKWFGSKIEEEKDENNSPIAIDGRQVIGIDNSGELYDVSVLIKTSTGDCILFSHAQVSLSFNQDGKVFLYQVSGQILAPTNEKNKGLYLATEKAVFPVTGITLNKSTLSLAVGEDETLVATIAPEDASNKKVVWTSSAPEKATVNQDGKVTGVTTASGTGKVIITAASESDPTVTATCEVTVTAS